MAHRALAPRPPWEDRRVLLGVTGGIAAYKSVQLARDLTRLGATVDTVLTRGARRFVGPLSFGGVTAGEVYGARWNARGGALHLRLAEEADLVLIAPATADLIARAAHGRADDLLTALLLATRSPVLLAPAMNDRMYWHPQTQRNLSHCREALGYGILGPVEGALAEGEGKGVGRMLEPEELCEHVGRALEADTAFRGRQVLVTAGPTREALDPVRFIGNRSSGRMGFAIAREAWLRGADVTLVTGPSELPDPVGVTVRRVESALDMLDCLRTEVPEADALVFSAAVSDYRPSDVRAEKLKRSEAGETLTVDLVQNPDLIRETRELRRKDAVAVGFALETGDLRAGAMEKLSAKELDLVVGNDPAEPGAGFEVSTNRVTLFFPDGDEEVLPLLSKEEVAARILDRIAPATVPEA